MNDLLENAKRNSKITLEEFFFEFYSKILEFEQETKIKENENIYCNKEIYMTRCGYVAQGAVAPASCPVCKETDFVTT